MQDELDRRVDVRLDSSALDEPGAALLIFYLLQRTLPNRLRLSDNDILARMMQLGGVAKRDLLKRLYAGWRKVGMPRPRGYVSIERELAVRAFTGLLEILGRIQSGDLNPNDYSHQEFEQYI